MLPKRFTRKELAAVALRYALAPACILLAVLLHLSPAGETLHPTGLFAIAVLAAAWFAGAGPGFLAAVLATFTLPQLITISYPLLGGFLDLPHLVTFSIVGLAVGWGSARRASKLREQERYAHAMSASDDGFWDWIPATDTVYASPKLLEIYGFAPGRTFNGRDDLVRSIPFHPEDSLRMARAIAEHLAGKRVRLDIQMRFTRDGETRWVHLVAVAVRDSSGAMVRWTGTVRDITEQKRVEEALRESEDRFARAVAGSSDGVWDVDLVGRTVYLSPRTRELCGLPPGPEVVPLDGWVEALPLHPEDRARRYAAAEAHLSGKAPVYEGEFRILQPDGVYCWRHLHGVCVRDAGGKPLRVAGSIADVDARRRAEDALRESEQRYERAMDSSEVGYWDWISAVDKIYASPRLLEIYGFAPGTSFAGRDDLVARIPFHAEDRPSLMRAYADHIAGKTARYNVEVRFIRDGETRWVSLTGMVARDASGTMVRWSGTVRDVTERKRSELALRQSEERYELAMAASESGYWDWDVATDRFFSSARANELVGLPSEATFFARANFRAHIPVHPDDFAKWEAAREELFAGTGERLSMELRYMVRGEARWHVLQGICKRDGTGKVIRWSGSATDVTERKRAEEELRAMELKLRQAQRLESMGTFAGGIAHDFNNILHAILGYGEMALRGAPKGSRLASDLDSIMTAGERGRALVGRLLTFSRSVVGERVPVHVERVVSEALELVSAKLPPGVTVDARLHAGRAAILGDATQVHQVVSNLATNAIHAMSAGGRLRVELAIVRVDEPRAARIGALAVGEYAVLTVADSGPGIAPEIMERIFDPFFTTKEVGSGTGLGLSLVHGIVTELGGGIDVNTEVGSGTTFTVHLPRSGEAPEAQDDADLALPRGEGQRVLVVDDEEPLVRLATRTLEELGYAPLGFTSSSAALAALRADPQRFDAVIADERMPGMSGSALIREVRGIRSAMPVVLMSGYLGPTADKVRESGQFHTLGLAQKIAAAIGADEVLQKPLSARDLATSMARVLRL